MGLILRNLSHTSKFLKIISSRSNKRSSGSSSEKLSPAKTELFDEVDDSETPVEAESNNPVESIDIAAHSLSTKRRVLIPLDIPPIDIVHSGRDGLITFNQAIILITKAFCLIPNSIHLKAQS